MCRIGRGEPRDLDEGARPWDDEKGETGLTDSVTLRGGGRKIDDREIGKGERLSVLINTGQSWASRGRIGQFLVGAGEVGKRIVVRASDRRSKLRGVGQRGLDFANIAGRGLGGPLIRYGTCVHYTDFGLEFKRIRGHLNLFLRGVTARGGARIRKKRGKGGRVGRKDDEDSGGDWRCEVALGKR